MKNKSDEYKAFIGNIACEQPEILNQCIEREKQLKEDFKKRILLIEDKVDFTVEMLAFALMIFDFEDFYKEIQESINDKQK